MGSSMRPDTSDIIECRITRDFEILRNSPIFAGIETEIVKLFAYLSTRKKFGVGDYIILMDLKADEAYYLLSGRAEITVLHNEREVALQHLMPQTFFGELALLARFKWFFNVRVVEECETLSITREGFKRVLDRFPASRERLIEKIVQLRVERLIEQTAFMLDRIPGSDSSKGTLL